MKSRMDEALAHAKNRALNLSHCDSKYIIHISVKELGIPSERDGAEYIRNAVSILYSTPGKKLSKGVYLAVGLMGEDHAGEDQVSQAIREAIQEAWGDRDEDIWACYFPIGAPGRTRCPTNKQFLMALVDYVKIWKAFCGEVNYEKIC